MNAPNFLGTRIGRRMLALFLGISLLPLGAVVWFALQRSEAALRVQTLAVLRAASGAAEAQLREFLQHVKYQVLQIARHQQLIVNVESLISSPGRAGTSSLLPDLTRFLADEQESIPEVQEIFILDPAGRLLASSAGEKIGDDFSSAEYFRRGQRAFFWGGPFKEPASGRITWVLAAPIRNGLSHRLLGVVAVRIDPHTLSDLTSGRRILAEGADTQSFRIGNSGETYIVNRDHLMITESRYLSNAPLNVKVESLPVRVAYEQGHEVVAEYKDYRGTQVSGASVILRDPDWVAVTEIDFTEAFVPIRRLRQRLIAITATLGVLASFLAWSSALRIMHPVRMLTQSDGGLAAGQETLALVPENNLPNDEIGELVRRRNSRVKAIVEYQRQLQDRTTKLREMIGELEHISYAIVHDMRAPLRAMHAFAELLDNDDPACSSEERRTYLQRIRTAALRLDRLTQDVLNYNRIVLQETVLKPVDLQPLVRGMLETYPTLHPDKADIRMEGVLPTVMGNEALLTQCFSNLLDNSVKFVPPATRPRIRIWAEPGHQNPSASAKGADSDGKKCVRISIEDNGIGIPPDAQQHIFRMFRRYTNDYPGTGLGLAIVKKVVERMHGQVGLNSEPGKGSTFWIELEVASS